MHICYSGPRREKLRATIALVCRMLCGFCVEIIQCLAVINEPASTGLSHKTIIYTINKRLYARQRTTDCIIKIIAN